MIKTGQIWVKGDIKVIILNPLEKCIVVRWNEDKQIIGYKDLKGFTLQ